MRLAYAAVRYGYQYRARYEADLAAGDVQSRYALPFPDGAAVFIALAAVSGIIGGASYDLVKSVVARLLRRFSSDTSDLMRFDRSVLDEEEEREKFLKYILEFVFTPDDIDPAVTSLLVEEMRAEGKLARLWDYERGDPMPEDILVFARDLVEGGDKPPPVDLVSFWSALPKNDGE